jgi:hypothetical protein
LVQIGTTTATNTHVDGSGTTARMAAPALTNGQQCITKLESRGAQQKFTINISDEELFRIRELQASAEQYDALRGADNA